MSGLWIRNARLPRALFDPPDDELFMISPPGQPDFLRADLVIRDGRIAEIIDIEALPFAAEVPPEAAAGLETLDARDGMLLPALVDCHTHLDKGHVWPRTPNPDGTFVGALESVARDREANWTADDVRARMDFALRAAWHHGTAAIRTHVDSIGKQIGISWPVVAEMRERWRDRITIQAAPLFGVQSAVDPAHMRAVAAAVKVHGDGILGAVAYMCPELEEGLDVIFRTAIEHGFELDFHVDESSDPAARALERIAAAAIRHRFEGRILCGHCCSLALQTPEDEARVIGMAKEAGISVVSLPLCNLYLQDRTSGRTPRWRGVTSLHELKAAGVPVMVASDNTRDPFYAYGDLDPLEVFRAATRIAHFDHPAGDWIEAVTAAPARAMGLADRGRIGVGAPADLVLVAARNWTELLSRPQSDRIVLRRGRRQETSLPDYRDLDRLEGMTP